MMEHRQKRSERIKPIDIISVIVLLVIVAVLAVLVYFCFHPQTQNVFDQIYYEVRAVKHRRDSVLIWVLVCVYGAVQAVDTLLKDVRRFRAEVT